MGNGVVGKASREKGARVEREIVTLHAEMGVKAERVPLSGAQRYQGNGADVDIYAFGPDAAPLVSEVKSRGNGDGFAMLERWLGDGDALFLRRDRAKPLVLLPWRVWAKLIGRLPPAAVAGCAAERDSSLACSPRPERAPTASGADPVGRPQR